jgi:thiamine transport system permease protein
MAERAQPVTLWHGRARGWPRSSLLAVLGPLLAVALAAEAPARLGPADIARSGSRCCRRSCRRGQRGGSRSPWRARWRGGGLWGAGARGADGGAVHPAGDRGCPGLLAIFGRAGWLNAGLEGIGAGTVSIYGLAGIVLAHVFLNLPLACG